MSGTTLTLSPPRQQVAALLVGIASAASFVAMDAMIKLIAARYAAPQLTFFRFASGSAFAVALWLLNRPALPERRAWTSHGLRSVFLVLALLGYFHALTLLPLAQTVAISYLSPLFMSLLAVGMLRERPSRTVWLAIGLGLGGVLIALAPELRASLSGGPPMKLLGILAAAGSALAFSMVRVLTRQEAPRDSLWAIMLMQNLLPMLMLAGPAALSWHPLAPADLIPIALAGALATFGLLGQAWAFRHLEACRMAPLEYSSFVWAAGLGYMMFGELPSLGTGLSGLCIVGGCLLLLRR